MSLFFEVVAQIQPQKYEKSRIFLHTSLFFLPIVPLLGDVETHASCVHPNGIERTHT